MDLTRPEDLIGRTVVDLLVSAKPLVGDSLPGLQAPRFYDVVLVLDSDLRVRLTDDCLEPWHGTEELTRVHEGAFELEPGVALQGYPVTKVVVDSVGDLVVEIASRTRLQVVTDYGTRIIAVPLGRRRE